MKKLFIYSLSALAALSFTACVNEEDDLFDESPAERLITIQRETKATLVDAPNGWYMQYFTINEEPGYNYLMRFDKTGAVKIAGNNSWIGGTYKEEESLFDMLADNGPVLSFSTFNTIFHIFADPADVPETPYSIINEQGYGHKGDYEFIINSVTPERVELEGKKWGKKIIMTPIPEGVDWQEFINGLDERKNKLFSSKVPVYIMSTPKGNFYLTHADGGYFYVVRTDGDPVVDTQYMPFTVGTDGMRLGYAFAGHNPQDLAADEKMAILNFKDAEDGSLVCTDEGQEAVITAPSAAELLSRSYDIMTLVFDENNRIQKPVMSKASSEFSVDLQSLTGEVAAKLTAMHESIMAFQKGERQIRELTFRYDGAGNQFVMKLRTNKYTSNYYLNAEVVDGKLKLENKNEGDKNGNTFLSKCPGIKDFLDYLASAPIEVSFAAPLGSYEATAKLADGSAFELSL